MVTLDWARHARILDIGMGIVYGNDRAGQPLWTVRPELHSPSNSIDTISCTYRVLEHIISLMGPGLYFK